MIFAREISDGLTSLVKKVDAENAKQGNKMASFVVFLSDEEGIDKKLKALAEKEGLKHTVLTVLENPAGPYNDVAKEADVTVIYYVRKKVNTNHAFKKGELTPEKAAEVAKDLNKILK